MLREAESDAMEPAPNKTFPRGDHHALRKKHEESCDFFAIRNFFVYFPSNSSETFHEFFSEPPIFEKSTAVCKSCEVARGRIYWKQESKEKSR